MREILFRGLCLDGDMWYRGYYVKCLTTKRTFMLDTGEITDTALFMDYAIEVIPETIGQYTGFKDKNGVKIFEGDVVDTHDADNNSSKALIKFSDGYLGIGGAFNDFAPICEFNYSQWEVLGSIEQYGHLVDDIDWEEVR